MILFTDQDVHADSIEVSQELLRQYKNLIINSCDKKQFAKAETFIELIQQALLPEKSDVRLQRLRDFTVQIRAAREETVVGVGLLVSTEGQIVTCAQVIEKASGRPLQQAKECDIDIYIPAIPSRDAEQRLAKVVASSPQSGVELVLLQLLGGSAPLTEEQLPVFGNAELSEQHPFRSYSYRCVAPYVGEYLQGTIVGSVDRTESNEQTQLLQLNVPQHQQIVSGNAILDVERNLVVGIVVDAEQFLVETPTIWAINAQVLESAPFRLPIYENPLALSAVPRPKVELEAPPKNWLFRRNTIAWYDAPEPVKDWVGREKLTTLLSQNWADPGIRITELVGFGGEGKSSLARKWVDELNKGIASTPENQRVRRPDGIFWWNFSTRQSIDEFFEAALRFLRGENSSAPEVSSTPAKVELIAAMLGKSSSVFVLDGLESMQSQTGDQYGMIKNDDLRRFLTYFSAPEIRAFCLITSRIPPPGIDGVRNISTI